MSVLKLAPCATGSPHLTVQSVPAFRPTTTTTSSRSLQRSTVGRGAVPGRWRPRVVPVCHPRTQTLPQPLAPSPPPRYLSPAFQSMLTGAQISYQSFCGKDIRRISDQDSRGLLKTNTLEQSWYSVFILTQTLPHPLTPSPPIPSPSIPSLSPAFQRILHPYLSHGCLNMLSIFLHERHKKGIWSNSQLPSEDQ